MIYVNLTVLVVGIGPIAREVSSSFDLYWNSELSYPITALIEVLPTEEEAVQRKKQFFEYVDQLYDSEYMQHLRDADLANIVSEHSQKYSWRV